MTESMLSQAQAAEIGYVLRVHVVTLRDNVSSCDICKALNVEPLL